MRLHVQPCYFWRPVGANCSSVAYPGLSIRVQDLSDSPVCDAVVTVTDGDFSQELTTARSSDCIYFGADERPGTYTIEAARRGAIGTVQGVDVTTTGDCHVIQTAQVTVRLSS